jgi:hypothetical protein
MLNEYREGEKNNRIYPLENTDQVGTILDYYYSKPDHYTRPQERWSGEKPLKVVFRRLRRRIIYVSVFPRFLSRKGKPEPFSTSAAPKGRKLVLGSYLLPSSIK